MEVKPGYKQTEVGVIPEEWDVQPLEEMANPKRPICYGIVQTGRPVSNGIRCVRVVDIAGGRVSAKNLITTSREISTAYKRTILSKGDLVVALRGKIGELAVIDDDLLGANLTRGVALLAPRESYESNYLCHALSSPRGKQIFEKYLNGSALQEIPIATLRKILVAVPSHPEQRAIAGTLSDMDALIGALDQLIAKKRDLKQAAMQQLLTGQTRLPGFHGDWVVKQLGELGSTFGGLTGKTKSDFGEGTARYITFMNIVTNVVIDCGTFERVRVSPAESQNRVMKGDLFFNGSSETPEEVGMCAVLSKDVQGVFLNSFCFGFRFRNDAEADGLFLAYYFRSREGRELLKSLAQGATRYNLSKAALLKVTFPFPSLPEQIAIAEVLSDMDAELAAMEQRRDKTRAIKQGMMQELLTGRIRLV